MRSLLIIFVIISIFLGAASCSKDKLPEIPEDQCSEPVTYDNDIQTIIQTNCSYSNCHDGSGSAPGNYNSYLGIRPFLNKAFFDDRVINLRDMPPTYATGPTALSQEEIDLIICWSENNYAEN